MVGKLLPEGVKAFFRKREVANEELRELRGKVESLLTLINEASVEAQMAVRGSPNEESAQTAHADAVRKATAAGQIFASLCGIHNLSPQVSPILVEHRHRFREVVTDDLNLDLVDPIQRNLQCASIEAGAAAFHQGVSDHAFKTWAIGAPRRPIVKERAERGR
jgi:hypothetical protein